jgi:hypothetical protein
VSSGKTNSSRNGVLTYFGMNTEPDLMLDLFPDLTPTTESIRTYIYFLENFSIFVYFLRGVSDQEFYSHFLDRNLKKHYQAYYGWGLSSERDSVGIVSKIISELRRSWEGLISYNEEESTGYYLRPIKDKNFYLSSHSYLTLNLRHYFSMPLEYFTLGMLSPDEFKGGRDQCYKELLGYFTNVYNVLLMCYKEINDLNDNELEDIEYFLHFLRQNLGSFLEYKNDLRKESPGLNQEIPNYGSIERPSGVSDQNTRRGINSGSYLYDDEGYKRELESRRSEANLNFFREKGRK